MLGASITPGSQSVINAPLTALQPNTTYYMYVTAVRPGKGGEGQGTPYVTVNTLSNVATTEETRLPPKISTVNNQQITTLNQSPRTTDAASQVPGAPADAFTVAVTSTTVTLLWSKPMDTKGIISLYHIDYRAIQKISQTNVQVSGQTFNNMTLNVTDITKTRHQITLQDLEPGTVYEVYLSAENEAGIGSSTLHVVVTQNMPQVQGSSTAVNTGVAVGVVLIVIIAVMAVIYTKRRMKRNQDQNSSPASLQSKRAIIESSRFENQAFAPDEEVYENVDLDDQEYEEITSSQWDIAWDDLSLSGKILGKGNFGEVQLRKVRIKGKWIHAAVKTLRRGTPVTERALFKEEFDTMTRIGHHPNVVNILGSCEHEGSLYVVLEYVHHGNLRKFLRKCRKEAAQKGALVSDLSPDQLLNFAIGVAKAMAHISSCGVIHRDLAARNILVGRGFAPKVSDFGMSREQNEYTQTSSRRVPTRWLSIESMTRKAYSIKSDVWSYGILLWEIATFGGTPNSDMETKQLAYHLTAGYRMPKPANCEEDMYELMLHCWQEDPDARPSFRNIVDILTNMSTKDKIYMSTHFYENFKYAVISLDKDDR